MNEPLAYLNREWVPVSEARLHVFDLGIVSGASATEQIRTIGGRPFRLDDHLDRLFDSLAALGRTSPLDGRQFAEIVDRLVEQNLPLIPAGHDLGIVLFVTAGQNLTYLGGIHRSAAAVPSVCAHTFPLPFELWDQKLKHGQSLVTPTVRAVPPESLDPRIKSRSRVHWHLADLQARTISPDAVALLQNSAGELTETSTANLLVVRDGEVITPAANLVLGGISLRVVREICSQLDLPFREASLTLHDLESAEEAMTSSTPYCLLPATSINGRPIGLGQPGPVFARLMDAWSRQVGVDLRQQILRGAGERRSSAAETSH